MRIAKLANLRGGGKRLGRPPNTNRYLTEPEAQPAADAVGLGIRNNLAAINAKEARWHDIYAHLGNGSNGDIGLVHEAERIEEEVDQLWTQRRRALQVLEQAYFTMNHIEHSAQTIAHSEYMEPVNVQF